MLAFLSSYVSSGWSWASWKKGNKEGRRKRERPHIPSRCVGLLLLYVLLSVPPIPWVLHTKKKQQYQKLLMAMPELNPACVGVTCFVIYCYDLVADLWLLDWDSARRHKKFLVFFFPFNSILLLSIAPPWMCCASRWNKTALRPLGPYVIFSSTIILYHVGTIKE